MNLNRDDINIDEIFALIKETVLRSYGVKSISDIDDTKVIYQITKKGKKVEGLFVKLVNNQLKVDVHLNLAYPIKITEAVRECHKSINYVLNKKYPKLKTNINVYIDNVILK